MRVRSNKCGDIYRYLLNELTPVYGERESRALATGVMVFFLDIKPDEVFLQFDRNIPESLLLKINFAKKELLKHVPFQYITKQAWFLNRRFFVNENVLIPRQETEELVLWARSDLDDNFAGHILEVGTGSGCIAISLKHSFPSAKITAIDICEKALDVAGYNAQEHAVGIDFIQEDIRKPINDALISNDYALIISNPPYIPLSEKKNLPPNVLYYEPELALFVEDDHVLLFYEAIAEYALKTLTPEGMVLLEIHEQMGPGIRSLMREKGFTTTLRQDIHGRDRMIKANLQ